eukprot:9475456-Pyramimonas_sp.AAC.1
MCDSVGRAVPCSAVSYRDVVPFGVALCHTVVLCGGAASCAVVPSVWHLLLGGRRAVEALCTR